MSRALPVTLLRTARDVLVTNQSSTHTGNAPYSLHPICSLPPSNSWWRRSTICLWVSWELTRGLLQPRVKTANILRACFTVSTGTETTTSQPRGQSKLWQVNSPRVCWTQNCLRRSVIGREPTHKSPSVILSLKHLHIFCSQGINEQNKRDPHLSFSADLTPALFFHSLSWCGWLLMMPKRRGAIIGRIINICLANPFTHKQMVSYDFTK